MYNAGHDNMSVHLAGVAQLVRASACHAEGRGFESLHSRNKKDPSWVFFRASDEEQFPELFFGTRRPFEIDLTEGKIYPKGVLNM